MLGLNWAVRESLRLYGNVSTSFDPPATTELANPYGPTGFNPDIESQTATNYEVGLKGLVSGTAGVTTWPCSTSTCGTKSCPSNWRVPASRSTATRAALPTTAWKPCWYWNCCPG